MPSWQARGVAALIRLMIRRRNWGDERQLARRARRVFGATAPISRLWTRGLRVEPVRDGGARGEWISPRDASGGAILYLHGGGFVSCSPATHRPITAGLARRTQRRVFAVAYRLAPEHRYPAALEDAVAAYRWVLAQGVAPTALALAGDSAGGGLVLSLLLRARDAGLALPACAVCFCPWADLVGTGESGRSNDGRCAMFRPENVSAFARAYLGDASARDPYASPLFADLARLPPLLLQVGSTELLLDDARRVHEKVRRAGGACRLDVFDGLFHVWQMLDGIVPEARVALRQAAAFIENPLPRS